MTEIVNLDAVALSRAIKSKQVSCVEVMTAYLDQIERLNPRVNAIVSIQPREVLLDEAKVRDAQLASGEHLGWMHGFPHAVKDLEPTAGFARRWARRCSRILFHARTRSWSSASGAPARS